MQSIYLSTFHLIISNFSILFKNLLIFVKNFEVLFFIAASKLLTLYSVRTKHGHTAQELIITFCVFKEFFKDKYNFFQLDSRINKL